MLRRNALSARRGGLSRAGSYSPCRHDVGRRRAVTRPARLGPSESQLRLGEGGARTNRAASRAGEGGDRRSPLRELVFLGAGTPGWLRL